jgi:hypothetical protein
VLSLLKINDTMKTQTKYILFVFTKQDNLNELVTLVAEELTPISYSPKINYYYDNQSMIFTFDSQEEFGDIKEYVDILFDDLDMTYVLLPYNTDNMSYNTPIDVSNHLFDLNLPEDVSGNIDAGRKLLHDELSDNVMSFFKKIEFNEEIDEEDDEDILLKQIKPSPLTLDNILDKINDCGISSLTNDELNLLNKYSK